MKLGGLQKLTLLDYPGRIACIVFTEGCNFRCPYCHNAGLVLPEQMTEPESEASVLSYLEKRRQILEGVVITGGEPLLQPDLELFLQKIHRLGYPVKLDTNGSFPERLDALLKNGLIHYAALDVKHAPAQYGKASGIRSGKTVSLVEQSIHSLLCSGISFEFRTTAVKGIHTAEALTELGFWLARMTTETSGPEKQMPPWFLQTYVDSGHVIAPEGLSPFSEREMEDLLMAAETAYGAAALRSGSPNRSENRTAVCAAAENRK